MKPRIRPVRRSNFIQAMYKCTGLNLFGVESVGYGKTIEQAYEDWKMYFDIPF